MNKNFVMAFSGGKDSMLGLYELIQSGYTPKCLLVTTGDDKESWFHGINKNLVLKVAESLDIEVCFLKCNIESYTEDFISGLKRIKEKYDIEFCGFGDIDIELHRKWDEDVSKEAGVKCILPLWNKKRNEVVEKFLKAGFKCVIKKVNLKKLDKNFLGKTLDFELIKEFEKMNIDICGENGEYHTFVFDGPLFKNRILFKIGDIKIKKDYGAIAIF
ncbi:MAG: diphthine--ammonia ligase [Clostridium sp.]